MQGEYLLLVQEEDLLLAQEEDLLLAQEEDLILVKYMKHENKKCFSCTIYETCKNILKKKKDPLENSVQIPY